MELHLIKAPENRGPPQERQLASNIKDAKADSIVSLIEAARILMVCREYLSINPDNPKVHKLISECRTVIAKNQENSTTPNDGVLTGAIAARYLEDSDSVDLDEFRSLSVEAAQLLSLHDRDLYLNSLLSLSTEAAAALANHTKTLSLRGLTALPDEVVTELSRHAGDALNLDGLTDLTPDVAHSLARYRGSLSLNGITALRLPAMESLSQHVGPELSMDGLDTLADDAATVLARHTGALHLWGLKSLSVDAAKALSRHTGKLSLWQLESPTAEVCQALEAKPTELSLDTVISPRIKALWEVGNRASPTELLSVLWESDDSPDWDRREKLKKTEHSDIPGGYGGPLERPTMTRWDIKKEGGRWLYRVNLIQVDSEFPVEELQVEAQRILDAVPLGIPVTITVENDQPGTDSECEFFWGDEEGYSEWNDNEQDEDETGD